MRNRKLALEALTFLADRGAEDSCVCAGRRDAPLIQLLEKQRGFRVHSFFEERSAAFFALGCAKRSSRPGVIVTTSGTAVAELLPAFIEAHYSGYSLIALTADRPRRLRGTGAPQTIDQVGLLGRYVSQCIDVEVGESLPGNENLPRGSLHFNLAFDEPLNEGDAPTLEFAPRSFDSVNLGGGELATIEHLLGRFLAPLVVVGPLKRAAQESVQRFVSSLGAPMLLEASSGLRGSKELSDLELTGGNGFVTQLLHGGAFDGVIRIGGVPSARCWRDLDEKLTSLPVLNISEVPYPGLGRGEMVTVPLNTLPPIQSRIVSPLARELIARDHAASAELLSVIESEPMAEVSFLRELSKLIPAEAALYLGNSLPIREWDLGALREKNWRLIEANRGANGIDGQLSTFFGWSLEASERWCILGDLTTLYDLSAPSCAPQSGKTRIVVVNNGGGQIFRRMFSEKLFRNEHTVSFEGWATMWGFEYRAFDRIPLSTDLPDRVVIELRPDNLASERMWGRYDRLNENLWRSPVS